MNDKDLPCFTVFFVNSVIYTLWFLKKKKVVLKAVSKLFFFFLIK